MYGGLGTLDSFLVNKTVFVKGGQLQLQCVVWFVQVRIYREASKRSLRAR